MYSTGFAVICLGIRVLLLDGDKLEHFHIAVNDSGNRFVCLVIPRLTNLASRPPSRLCIK